MQLRKISRQYPAITQHDGDGAVVHRTLGNQQLMNLDPFLLLDEFELKEIAESPGFPDHPHRGFETVTYMFGGIMTHRDTVGNSGTIGPGDIQWMTAGGGLVHSETPDYSEGDVHGMQLWVNLPRTQKMRKPRYQDIPAKQVPDVAVEGGRVRVLAGSFGGVTGPVKDVAIAPLYYDITIDGSAPLDIPVGQSRTVMIYAVEDGVTLGGKPIQARTLAIMSNGDTIRLEGEAGARAILIAGEPIGEPIARYGPFVMNTRDDIMRTVADWNNGTFLKGHHKATGKTTGKNSDKARAKPGTKGAPKGGYAAKVQKGGLRRRG